MKSKKQTTSSSGKEILTTFRIDLDPNNYPSKYSKFVPELDTLLNFVTVANEMISESNKKMNEAIEEIIVSIRELQNNLVMALQNNRIDDDKLMAICIAMNDDISQTIERYNALKSNKKPEKFITSFIGEYIEYNLDYKKGYHFNPNEAFNLNNGGESNNTDLISFEKNESVNAGDKNKFVVQSQNNQQKDPNTKKEIKDINDLFDALN